MTTVNDRSTERWEIDPARSSLGFTLRHLVVQRIAGRFGHWGGTLFIDRQQPWLSSVQVWIDLASITTDDAERDAHVRSSEFLDVARFPRAEFQSTNVALSDGQVVVEGILNLHGVAHDVEIRAEAGAASTGADGSRRATYAARGIIDRQSFGLHWNQDLDVGGVVVGDDVEVVASLALVGRDHDTRDDGPALVPSPG